jgi:hypothetical protein
VLWRVRGRQTGVVDAIAGVRRRPPLGGGGGWGYVDCALSGSSARGGREPGVGDLVFALMGEG